MLHKLGAAIFAALLVVSLAACSFGNPQKAGDTFVADASGSLKGVSKVEFYVFPEGAQESGIRPDVRGLPQSPTVQEIRDYASSNS